MQRVLHVVGGMNRAGAETMLMNVYRKLDKNKLQFDFLVYTNEKQDYEDEIINMGGKVLHVPYNSGFSMIKSIAKIREIIKEDKSYCAIHAHTLHNSCYALIATKENPQIVRIAHSHNTHNVVEAGIAKKIYEKLTKLIIRKYSDEWLACGQDAGKYLFGDKFIEKGYVINNGLDLQKYCITYRAECATLIEKYKLENCLVLGSVARLMPVKNHAFMLKIAEKLKDNNVKFKMLLVGQGDLKEDILKNIIQKKLEKEVILLGVREDIPALLKVFDVFLMPSFFEGNPVTLIEAQASGLPCVVSNVITEEIDMGLGLIHKCSLEDSLDIWVDKIMMCKGQKTLEYAKIQEAFKKNKYDVESTVETLMKIYTKKRRR